MTSKFEDEGIQEIASLLGDYFDGLYDGDLEKFERVFHKNSHLYFAEDGSIGDWSRATYFEKIKSRPSPAEQGLPRHDKIISINKAGPDTALAIVTCAIPPRYFTDYLTLLKTSSGWKIISKTFHTDIHQ
ncbi:MAG: hypothetical protein CMM58_00245 [Rhodospirillaceae bacterium]|nr:hypothetical protein [Rhodospirillaceae bacterium]|tara:strand:- start:631 stop:1020 length:390 start_codon:yes stop_codon:yes gene_type:complete